MRATGTMKAAGALRAEWTKFASIRATVVLSGAAVAVSGLLAWLFGSAATRDYTEATAAERLRFDPMDPAMRGVFIVQLLVAGLGALIASSEYGSGTIAASVAAVGRRRLVAAKAGMTVLSALPVSVAAIWLMFGVSMATMASHGVPTLGAGDPAALITLLVGPLVLTSLALVGLSLGLLARGTAAAVNISTALLLLPVFATVSPGWLRNVIGVYWPNTAAFRALSADPDLPRLLGLGILAGFTAVLLGVAFARFESRDV